MNLNATFKEMTEVTSETLFHKTYENEVKMSEPYLSYDAIAAADRFKAYVTVLIDLGLYPDYIERKDEMKHEMKEVRK